MVKYLDIKGCSVIDEGGEAKGIVEDCIFDCSSKKVYSFIVVKKTPLIHSYILKFKDIKHLGDNLMTKEKLFPIDKNIITKNTGKFLNCYFGKAIVDSNGNELGIMMDAFIDENTGIIKGIICSRGFVEDIMEGRKVILLDKESIFGQDKIIIRDNSINIYNDMSLWKLTKG